MKMNFQDEMKQMFLRVTAGEVEPEEWENWWNSNKIKLDKTLTRGRPEADHARFVEFPLRLDGEDTGRRCENGTRVCAL